MRTAAAHPGRVAAVAAFHGPVGADGAEELRRLLFGPTAEVRLGNAGAGLTPGALDELGRALGAAGVRHTGEICPGTVHGATMSDTGAFDPAGPQHHRNRLLPLLGRTPNSDRDRPAETRPDRTGPADEAGLAPGPARPTRRARRPGTNPGAPTVRWAQEWVRGALLRRRPGPPARGPSRPGSAGPRSPRAGGRRPA